MKYDGEQLKAMANKIDIVDYIGQTEQLHRKGNNYFIKCPFHQGDNTPSLCIYPESNKWYCFGCGAGSSIYDWIIKTENISFGEAVDKVAQLTNTEINNITESESIALLKELKKNKHQNNKTSEGRTILDFQKDFVGKYDKSIPQEWLEEGMTKEGLQTYNIMIDNNANRIVYPVFDKDGNFIGVKGRTRLSGYKELGLSKYINYQKIGTVDYFQGWQQATNEGLPRTIIIFEGIKSCIKAWGWGIKNTVASETAALSDGQLKLLIKSGFKEVIIGWDTDQSFKSISTDNKIKMLKKFTTVSIIQDTRGLLDNKQAPVDKGEAIFRELLEKRKRL